MFSMAIVGPWAAYAVYRGLRAMGSPTWLQVFCAMAVANLTTYLVTSVHLAVAHPDEAGGFLGALAKFSALFALTQIPLALIEGLLGVLLFGFLARAARPELVRLGVVKEPAHV